jgi:hypothetical protein
VLRIIAKSPEHAWRRAKGQVLRMQGGATCEEIIVMKEV